MSLRTLAPARGLASCYISPITMHWLKVSVLLIAVLAAMRLGSWLLGWILAKITPIRAWFVAIAANVIAFSLFMFLLVRELMPGEPVDVAALVFGLTVFAICGLTDLYWRPWKAKG